MTYGFLDRWKW